MYVCMCGVHMFVCFEIIAFHFLIILCIVLFNLRHNFFKNNITIIANNDRIGMIFVFYGLIQFLSSIGWLPPGFLPYNDVIYSMLGTSLFTMYLAYHTRLIVSGKHTKYQLNEKDYVFGAVLLYNDIINIFLYLLRVLENDDR